MVTKNQHIELIVKHTRPEIHGYWSVVFHRPPSFRFEAGDWIDIQFEGRQLSGGITYSLSSSPTESDLRITFREGQSELKQVLQTATPGETLIISRYGNDYDFKLKKNQSSVLIAGGVGIAPFRSMLKEMYDSRDKNDVTLIYINQIDQMLFKHELELWNQALPSLTVINVATKHINRKSRQKLILSHIKSTNQNFYISGPPAMVESNEHLLIDAGISVRNIRIDSFSGY